MLHHQQCANLPICHHFDCLIHGGVGRDRRNCPGLLLEYHTDCRCKFSHGAPRASNSTPRAQLRANAKKQASFASSIIKICNLLTLFFAKPRSPTATSAPDRFSGSDWRCLVANGSASKIPRASTASA